MYYFINELAITQDLTDVTVGTTMTYEFGLQCTGFTHVLSHPSIPTYPFMTLSADGNTVTLHSSDYNDSGIYKTSDLGKFKVTFVPKSWNTAPEWNDEW